MFNGIIKKTGKIKTIIKKKNNCILEIKSSMKFNYREIGESICCSGACLTLESFNKTVSRFYISKETLKKTIFKHSKKSDVINLEKSLKYGNRVSGHYVQGHVDLTSKIKNIVIIGKSWLITFSLNNNYKKYLIPKGSITINGVSLTIAKIIKNGFQISLIPHTLKLTNLIYLRKSDIVNVEFDVLSKYIKNFLK